MVFREEGNNLVNLKSRHGLKIQQERFCFNIKRNFFIGKKSAAILQVGLGRGEPVWWVQGHCGGHNVSFKNQLNKWTSRP